ncbi:MAG: hypothetical protein L0Z62_21710, partial [Gemmataceae bacterium]|nr:hypothetical protein [Gemmataceae bacterium]
ENAMYQSWILRRQAQSFRGSTSKVAQFFAVLCGRGAVVVLLTLVYLCLVFLHQHHPDYVPYLAENWLGEELQAFPVRLTYLSWVLILLFVLNLYVTMSSLKRRFSRKERPSSTNT